VVAVVVAHLVVARELLVVQTQAAALAVEQVQHTQVATADQALS